MEFLNEGIDVLGNKELQEVKAGVSCGDWTCYIFIPIQDDEPIPIGICVWVIQKD